MRNVTYVGKKSVVLAGKGQVNPGDTLCLTEPEAFSVIGNDEFRFAREMKPEGFPDLAAPPSRDKCRVYPLDRLPWKTDRLFKHVQRLKKGVLAKVANEMMIQGFPELPEETGADAAGLRDYILTTGRLAGWV